MASYKKQGTVWRVQVAKRGVRASGTFSTKREAEAWATEQEAKILKGTFRGAGTRTLGDLFDAYGERVSPTKGSEDWELARFKAFKKYFPELTSKALSEVDSNDWGVWRDQRLKGRDTHDLKPVSAATVLREINLFSHAFTTARDEWKWIEASPLSGVRRPKEPHARDRRVSEDEIERLLYALGYEQGKPLKTISARCALAFLFAIETGARASEICGLTWDRVHEKYVHLDKTKNGYPRNVALSIRARKIIEELRGINEKAGTVFELTSMQLASLFLKARKTCGIKDLHFHDSRHEATTRLAKKLDVLDLARQLGIRDLKILMVYYNATAHDMADSLE